MFSRARAGSGGIATATLAHPGWWLGGRSWLLDHNYRISLPNPSTMIRDPHGALKHFACPGFVRDGTSLWLTLCCSNVDGLCRLFADRVTNRNTFGMRWLIHSESSAPLPLRLSESRTNSAAWHSDNRNQGCVNPSLVCRGREQRDKFLGVWDDDKCRDPVGDHIGR